MCGIAGIIPFEGTINDSLIEEMINEISHRGPDQKKFLNLKIQFLVL